MTDVWLFNTADGGDIEYRNGNPVMSDGLAASVYLSLFGGNQDDPGIEDNDPREWWGDFDEDVEARKQRSRTQHILDGLPMIPANLRRIEDAARDDLAWLVTEGIADTVAAQASITAPKRLSLTATLTIDEEEQDFTFTKSDNTSG